jgi:hypothetical protein
VELIQQRETVVIFLGAARHAIAAAAAFKRLLPLKPAAVMTCVSASLNNNLVRPELTRSW